MKFKESVRRGFIPNELQEITKNLTLEDEKRFWAKPYNIKDHQTSTPINFVNGMTQHERIQEQDKIISEEWKTLNISVPIINK